MSLSPIIPIAFVAWLVAQSLKFLLSRRSNPQAKFTDSGGMPSAHSAVIAAAATVIALERGTGSMLFGLAVVVAAIVVHDAYRLRWSVGEQAARLNAVSKKVSPGMIPLVVWRGHRLREVAAGLVLGTVIAVILDLIF